MSTTPLEAGPATLDRIRQYLVGLKMPRALEALEHILRRLERGELSALEAIDALLGEELTLREGRRIKAALKMGRLLSIKTLTELPPREWTPDYAARSSACSGVM